MKIKIINEIKPKIITILLSDMKPNGKIMAKTNSKKGKISSLPLKGYLKEFEIILLNFMKIT